MADILFESLVNGARGTDRFGTDFARDTPRIDFSFSRGDLIHGIEFFPE